MSGMPYGASPRSMTRAMPGWACDVDLVDDRAGDLDPLGPEQRGVEDDLVDRATDAALADDEDGGAEERRDGRVREPDHRADAGMAGALDEQDVVVAEGGLRVEDPRAEVLDDVAGDVGLREAARDVHGTHHGVRLAAGRTSRA